MKKLFKCAHCENDMPIPLVILAEALNEGKSVLECEHCKKLNTIRSDDGERVYVSEVRI